MLHQMWRALAALAYGGVVFAVLGQQVLGTWSWVIGGASVALLVLIGVLARPWSHKWPGGRVPRRMIITTLLMILLLPLFSGFDGARGLVHACLMGLLVAGSVWSAMPPRAPSKPEATTGPPASAAAS